MGTKGTRKRPRKIGPYSKPDCVLNADRRTREGAYAKAVRDNLTAHVGGEPSAAEQLLIDSTTVLAVVTSIMGNAILEDSADAPARTATFLAWNNTLRRNLEALGIKSKAKALPAPLEYAATLANQEPKQ